jgi:hypothetical protein
MQYAPSAVNAFTGIANFPAEAVFDYGELSVLHPCKA